MKNTSVALMPISASSLQPGWVILGILAAVRVNIVGEIYIGELLAVAALPFLIVRGRLDRHVLYILAIATGWSAGQLVSDLINETETASMMKGVLAPAVFAATIASAAMLFNCYPRRMPLILLGVALTLLLNVVFRPTPVQIFQPWKWGYGFAVLAVALVWLSFFNVRSTIVTIVTILLFSVICIVENARSLAMIPFVGLLAYLFWQSNFAFGIKRWLTGRFGVLKVVVLVILIAWLLNSALTVFFASGVLDPFLAAEVATKYRQQASTEVGLLLSGRSESLSSIRAYLDAPIVGHGSWAIDKSGYVDQLIQLMYQYGITENQEGGGGIDGTLIPVHSFLLGAMVWAGLVGGAFWILFTFRILNRYLKFAAQLPLYFHVGLVYFLWNLLFSPFGAESRWALAVFVAALLAACAQLGKAHPVNLNAASR